MHGNHSKRVRQKILQTIRKHRVLENGMHVLVAVSGGRDSVVLLRCLRQLADHPFGGLRLEVAHLNHGLRGKESDGDQRFVAGLAHELGLVLHADRVDVVERAGRHGRNLEEAARLERYEFLRDTARRIGAERIATGHTLSDQAETVLMRMIRGSGTGGLSAIYPMVDGLIIRPLLEVTREETTGMCQESGWPFREDSSNTDLARTRNRIRTELIPLLREFNPRLERTLGRLSESAQKDEQCFDQIMRNLMTGAVISTSEEALVISLKEMRSYPESVQRRFLRHAIRMLRPDGRTIDHQRVMDGLELIQSARSGSRIDLGRDIQAWREFDRIHLFRMRPSTAPEPVSLREGSSARFGLFELSVQRSVSRCEIGGGEGSLTQYLDERQLPHRLSLRRRRPGDAYVPAAHRSVKKVKDLMIASRIPASRRADWPLLVDAETDILICGPRLPVNRQFALRPDSDLYAAVHWKCSGAALNLSPWTC